MIQYRRMREPGRQTLQLQRFRGVDFRSADTQVDASRSPDACNMMAGENVYFPVKRPGYRLLHPLAVTDHANGIFAFEKTGVMYILVHSGTFLLRFRCENGELTEKTIVSETLADAPSDGFVMDGCFWLLDGTTFWRYTGTEIDPVSDCPYIPMTSSARTPAGAGKAVEPVNLLTGWRYNSFAADGTAKDFRLDAEDLDADEVTVLADGVLLKEGKDFTVDRKAGILHFAKPPKKFTGADNVTAEFSKTIPGNTEKINRCRIAKAYGGKNDTRVFVSGNPDSPNCDWYSGLYDPAYFPDTGYTCIGADASAIMGYARQYDSLIVIKDGKYADAAMYLRTCSFDEAGEILFPLQQGSAGDGCVSAASVAVYQDTPLYVSENGVRAVVGTEVYEQRNIRSRSAYIDSRLTAHQLQESCSCVHEGRYYLAVDGVCYVADLRQTGADASSEDGGMQFEWYYWDNIPAKRMLSLDGYLWMLGRGGIYRFYRFEEKGIYQDAGKPVHAWWTTPLLDISDGTAGSSIRSISVLLQPMQHAGCSLRVESNGIGMDEDAAYIDRRYLDLLDWEDVDFNRFSFSALYQPKWEKFSLRRRKTKLFAIRAESDGFGDGMGIYRITADIRQ